MPLMIRARNPTAPSALYVSGSQPIYENPFLLPQDLKKETEKSLHHDADFQDEVCCQGLAGSVNEHANLVVNTAEEPEEIAREVPYYTEDEAFPETVYEPEARVTVPDMTHEIPYYYPNQMATRWMPPPPPPPRSTTVSSAPMHFWYKRLLAHPLYGSCRRLFGKPCPAPQEASYDAEWAEKCCAWWESVCTVMRDRELAELTTRHSWNPYNLRNNVRFHEPRSADGSKLVDVHLNPSVSRFPVPPPPEYEIVYAQYAGVFDTPICDALYIAALVRWWRQACQWSAVMAAQRSWVCPPPTTGVSPASWAHSVDCWWSITLAEMRHEDDRKARHNGSRRSTAKISTPQSHAVSTSSGAKPFRESAGPLPTSICKVKDVPARTESSAQLW